MKRFTWPLQRLLEVTVQRERALKAELLALSREVAGLRQRILRRQVVLRGLLGELAQQQLQERIPALQVFLQCAELDQRQIRRLQAQLKSLELQRREKTTRFLKTRASRETLERRREQARQLHLRAQLRIEQAQFDETAHVAFARRAARERAAQHEIGI